MVTVRPEQPGDIAAVFRVHVAAFPTDEEARLVDRLRTAGKALVSLVAQVDGEVVGHVLFSPVTVTGPAGTAEGIGMAPLAVLPAHQRRGIGSALTRAGLDRCRAAGYSFVVLLGHPDYYPRFGFRRASDFDLDNEYGAGEAFMALELRPGGLPAGGGLVRYAPEFAELEA
jgi:putative acetyltransferase